MEIKNKQTYVLSYWQICLIQYLQWAILFVVTMDRLTSAYQIWWRRFGRSGVVG